MAHLDKDDIQQIENIFQKQFQEQFQEQFKKHFFEAFNTIWEDNIEPTVATKDELKDLKKEIDSKPSTFHMNTRFDALEKMINEKAIDPSVKRDRTLNEKGDTIAKKLEDKKVFAASDVAEVRQISPVAISPKSLVSS